jgi:hypothetical protein
MSSGPRNMSEGVRIVAGLPKGRSAVIQGFYWGAIRVWLVPMYIFLNVHTTFPHVYIRNNPCVVTNTLDDNYGERPVF